MDEWKFDDPADERPRTKAEEAMRPRYTLGQKARFWLPIVPDVIASVWIWGLQILSMAYIPWGWKWVAIITALVMLLGTPVKLRMWSAAMQAVRAAYNTQDDELDDAMRAEDDDSPRERFQA